MRDRRSILASVKLKTVLVKGNAQVPKGYSISHSVLIEPKTGKPYFAVLFTDEKKQSDQHGPAIGYHLHDD